MRPRRLIAISAVLLAASPAAASFSGHAESAGSGAGAAAVFRPVPGEPAPEVTSLARFGATLTASTGAWGRQPTSFSSRWLRCDAQGAVCAPTTGGATVTAAEIGRRLRVEVTARNAGGSATATSAASPGVPPAPKDAGTITGSAVVGATLTFASGGWATNPALTATTRRAWWRCPTATWSPDACTRLAATGTAYVPVAGDAGAHLRVVEELEQGRVSGEAVSAGTAIVVPPSERLSATAQGATGPHAYGQGVENIADVWLSTALMTSPENPVTAGQWVRVDFGAVRTLTRYRVEHRMSSSPDPFDYAIEASTDGLGWTPLKLPVPLERPRYSGNGDVTLPAPVRARYLRLRAKSTMGNGWAVYGLEGWGF